MGYYRMTSSYDSLSILFLMGNPSVNAYLGIQLGVLRIILFLQGLCDWLDGHVAHFHLCVTVNFDLAMTTKLLSQSK